MTEMRSVGVVGADPFNLAKLGFTRRARDCLFRPLVGFAEARELAYERGDMDALLRLLHERLDRLPEPIAGLVTWWDFPMSTATQIVAHDRGLPAAPLEAVLKCEHKYWSRLEQRAALREVCPRFCAVDPFDPRALASVDLPFPFWVKPVKAHSSLLGFRVEDAAGFERAMEQTRRRIGRLAAPFDAVLRRVRLPPEVAGIDGHHCVAEEIISHGAQCTVEGYVHGGEVVVYGVVDSVRYEGCSSFARYQYPSALPREVTRRIEDAARRVMTRIGYDGAPFNMEFFHDAERGRLRLLEVNPRISQSHGDLFHKVDGMPHHEVAVDLALGRRPELPRRRGRFALAAKCFVRCFLEDGVVRRIPTRAEVRALQERFPGTVVEPLVRAGTRLSGLQDQDSYSYALAYLYLGASDEAELLAKREGCLRALRFEVEPAPALV